MHLIRLSASAQGIISFFVTSILSSFFECVMLCLVGGSTVSSVWHLVIGLGYEEKSIAFYLVFIAISVPTIWIALFWFKILFIPSSRGKLSIFSPLPINVCQISFKNDDLIPVVAGTWLILWAFVLTIGWSFAIRQETLYYKLNNGITAFPNCCKRRGSFQESQFSHNSDISHNTLTSQENFETNFSDWFTNSYLPNIGFRQMRPIDERKFLVFQPDPSLSFEHQINGLLSSFALALVSDRELLVDWADDMNEAFLSPGWEWRYEKLFPKRPITHTILDLVTPPSFIVPPAHKWRWSDILQANISEKLFLFDKVVLVDCDEFIAPLIWANPVYRSFLCSICNIDEAYTNFASVLLVFSKNVKSLSTSIKTEIGNQSIISVADSTIASVHRLKTMTDTMLRCMDSIDNDQQSWLLIKKGSGFSSIKWKKLGPHKIFTFDDLECLKKVKNQALKTAALFHLTKSSEAIVGFTGSALAESLAYSSNKQLFLVLHRTPFCGNVAVRIPCVEKWNLILNSPGINLTQFMVSEMTNFMYCRT
ncbi:hypothetical protein TRFO_34152 [Tritrichomonas foetus]|uniref:Uncharacterized protein n=1 Tax=Tritrichomonas foetus TaxID=1144522 RepID=A0A1J4JL40_9EUKA|nr:hypothetical protein TRFO_34152 [Tritrichomonas foetus]|eukprot:OHS99385.1 hypothetical protein TRFO_34152 [Tritrichomonas foetus]